MKIYFLHTDLNETPFYVGSTNQSLQTRKENHSSDFRTCKDKGDYIKKIKDSGQKLRIKLIEDCSKELGRERETFYIKSYLKDGIKLLNRCDDSSSNSKLQRLIAAKTIKEVYNRPEIRKKIKESNLKRSKAIIINDIKYLSINEASRKTGISPGLICLVANKKRKSKKYKISFHGLGS